jgi:flagellar protein FlaJ
MLQVIAGVLLSLGIFFVIADLMRIPSLKTSKTISNLSKRQKQKTKSLELWLKDLSVWLSKYIRLNEYRKLKITSDLQSANINITPELHIANAVVKSVFIGLFAIPLFIIFPLISPVVIVIAFAMYFNETKSVEEKIRAKRNAIDYELPRLVFTIDKTLKHNRDVLSILEGYKESAAPELEHELNITVADMRSGNYESALTRLEARVGSPMLSDVVRGLIGVLRGDNTEMFWASLSIKFADIQRQLLRQQAQKVPSKVKRLSILLLFCFMAVYLVVIVMQIMTSLSTMFG